MAPLFSIDAPRTSAHPMSLNNTSTYSYHINANSNRLQSQSGAQALSHSYDSAGNLTSDGIFRYGYNAAGRRTSATAAGQTTTYGYDALGQRVTKTVAGSTTRYFYDEHGHLTGEYNAAGRLIQEIIWLGDLPIAVLKPATPTSAVINTYYIHSDHLDTPRKITRPADNRVVWNWVPEAFGSSLPNQNPSGLGNFVFNLRFPGQYYDQETGLHYNMARYYNPKIGRYEQSDPIGLRGGINTYAYVGGNPVNYTDPLGLTPGDPFPTMNAAATDVINWVYGNHPSDTKEWAGTFYRGKNGEYYATDPKRSSSDTQSSPSYPPSGPWDVEGYYHTHGQCTDDIPEDDFSRGKPPSDVWQADFRQKTSYLGTPGGFVKRYTPDPNRQGNGTVTTIQQGKCCPGEK